MEDITLAEKNFRDIHWPKPDLNSVSAYYRESFGKVIITENLFKKEGGWLTELLWDTYTRRTMFSYISNKW